MIFNLLERATPAWLPKQPRTEQEMLHTPAMIARTATCCTCLWLAVITDAEAQQANRRLSNTKKCAIFQSAFEKIMQTDARASMSASFIKENKSFITNGCADTPFVCPRNAADLAAVNALTVATMNRGMASTFVPFKCPKD